MRPEVVFELDTGAHHVVPHGGIIGRLGTAALVLQDARVSEAHAMVSLRGAALELLSLRGRFAHKGKSLSTLTLRVGQSIYLAQGLKLQVLEVRLPDQVLALEGPGVPRRILSGVVSFVPGLDGPLRQGFDPQAVATLWNHDASWFLRQGEGPAVPIAAGDHFEIAGQSYSVVRVELERAGGAATLARGGIEEPLLIMARYDSVQICQGGQERLVLSGLIARLVSELVSFQGPVAWDVLAAELWDEPNRTRLRNKLDTLLYRLRAKLQAAGLRTTLVQAVGTGHIELLLVPGDRAEDLT